MARGRGGFNTQNMTTGNSRQRQQRVVRLTTVRKQISKNLVTPRINRRQRVLQAPRAAFQFQRRLVVNTSFGRRGTMLSGRKGSIISGRRRGRIAQLNNSFFVESNPRYEPVANFSTKRRLRNRRPKVLTRSALSKVRQREDRALLENAMNSGDMGFKRSRGRKGFEQGRGRKSLEQGPRRRTSENRGRGGQKRGGRGKNVTSEKLDAMLDSYMGDDARKARLDAQLDSYFTGSCE